MRRLGRWLAIAALVGLLLVVVAGLAAWWIARTYGPAITRERVEAALADALERPVRVERVVFQPWAGRFGLDGVTVAAGPTWDTRNALELRRLRLRVGLASLWRRELVISRILLQDLEVHWVASGDGPAAAPPPALPDRIALGPVTALIGTVEVERARLVYRDPGAARDLTVEGLALSARPVGGGVDATVRASLVGITSRDLDERLQALDATLRLRGDRLEVGRATGRWEGATVRLSGEATGLGADLRVALRVEADAPLAPLARRAASPWPVDGTARVAGTVEGAPSSPRVAATVEVPDLRAGPVRARRVRADVTWREGELRLEQVAADAFDGTVRGDVVTVPARPAETRIRFRLERVALDQVAALAPGGAPELRGRISADGELRGDPRRPGEVAGRLGVAAATLTLPGPASRLGEVSVSGEARFANGVLDIARATARGQGVGAVVEGRVDLGGARGLRARLTGDLGALARLGAWRDVAGEATLVAEARGDWATLAVSGRVTAPVVVVQGARLQQVAIPFALGAEALRVDGAVGVLGESRVQASGAATWTGPRPVDLAAIRERVAFHADLRARAARVEDLGPWLPAGWPRQGRFDLSVRVAGTLAAWRVTGEIEAGAIVVRYPLEDVRGRFVVTADGVEVDRLAARALGVPLSVAGLWRWDGEARARADFGPAPLTTVPGLPERLDVRGRARGRVDLERVRGRLTGSAAIEGEDVAVAGFALGAGRAHVTLRGDDVDARVEFPDSRVTASARGPLRERASIDVRLRAERVRAERVAAGLVPERFGPVGGSLTLTAELAVPLADPSATRGALTLDLEELVLAGERWRSRGPVLLRRAPGAVHLDRLELAVRQGEVSGAGVLQDSGRLDLRLRGAFPVALLAALRPEVREAEGRVDAAVVVAGTLRAPEVTGQATIVDGVVALRDYPDAIRNIHARVTATRREVRLVTATGSLGGGELALTGAAALDDAGIGAFRFALNGRGVGAAPIEGLETRWDLDLELAGYGPRAELRGEARLLRGTYERDIRLLPMLVEARRAPVDGGSGGGLNGAGVSLDVRVLLGDQLLVRTGIARFRADGTLRLQGTTSAPAVFGTLTARDGQIVFRKHTFTLTSASARFVDPRRIDPILDVRGVARIRSWDVTLHISGRSDDLQIRFASSPPLPEEDILSLVAFGATRAEVGRSGAGMVLGELAGFVVQDFLGVKSDQAGLDVLEVETAEAGERTLKVGKQITPRMLLLYSQGLQSAEERLLRVEYQVIGPLRVAGEQDFRGGFGADVLVRLRFR